MTKQELIKQAYGESWDLCKHFVDENGFCVVFKDADHIFKGVAGNKTHFKEHEIEGGQLTHSIHGKGISFRPKTLKGIENNNGWTKIESRDDLPKADGMYLFYFRDNSSIEQWHQDDISIGGATHWRPIVKIHNPLY